MLTVYDLMKKFNVCRQTIYNWHKRGLSFIKVGGLTFIDEKELEKFIKKGE